MANTKQARKRARQTVARNLHLAAQRSQYRTAIKKVRKLVAAGDKAAAQEAFKAAESTIDKMARKGVLQGPRLIEALNPTAAVPSGAAGIPDCFINEAPNSHWFGALFYLRFCSGMTFF